MCGSIAIGVVAWLASRPTWSKFQVFDNVDDANTMTKALDDQSITWKASSDGKTIYVHQDDMTNALYTMSDNGLQTRDIHGMMHLTIPCQRRKVKRLRKKSLHFSLK